MCQHRRVTLPRVQHGMPQPPSEKCPSPGNSQKIHVALPEAPPAMTDSVANVLLQLLQAMIADADQPRPEPGDT
jgi:hypothetical protein